MSLICELNAHSSIRLSRSHPLGKIRGKHGAWHRTQSLRSGILRQTGRRQGGPGDLSTSPTNTSQRYIGPQNSKRQPDCKKFLTHQSKPPSIKSGYFQLAGRFADSATPLVASSFRYISVLISHRIHNNSGSNHDGLTELGCRSEAYCPGNSETNFFQALEPNWVPTNSETTKRPTTLPWLSLASSPGQRPLSCESAT